MDVQRAAGEGLDVRRRQNPHVAGVADEPDPMALELPHQCQVELLTIREILGIDEHGRNAGGPGPVEHRGALPIADDDDHPSREVWPRAGVQNGAQVRAPTGR